MTAEQVEVGDEDLGRDVGGVGGRCRPGRLEVDAGGALQQAHLGEAEAVAYSMEATLERAARQIDDDPDDRAAAHRRALAVRGVVARGCLAVLEHAAAALGPRAMAFDGDHAQRIVDLDVYVRQDHGRRDAEQLGRLVRTGGPTC